MSNEPWDHRHAAFQSAIKQIRLKAKLTQAEVAEQIGKPQSYVSKYERGERKLDYIEVLEICAVCAISIARFQRLYESNL